ncbi:YbcC family protein [Shinella kummerowiae]|uniref:Probable inorganic carbon transporter subunit DabA n=1 Tax=Shinella kummerowiae TaxID=417745 RepID=A0A6N8SQE5_9HYPH|nr:DUF2309 domain-containing protein [Shinella kummerowiae]MCT7667913.1 DUF2309 domain-containing protein [Shinella kummerowiae]MXN49160.1 DUF2309 family protein [Shinella kummerowiae]
MADVGKVETLHGEALVRAANEAVGAVPPAWPLTTSIAVNPFLGQVNERFDHTAARLARIGGIRLALPRKHYSAKIANGEIADEDLIAALDASVLFNRIDLRELKIAAAAEPQHLAPLPTISELAAQATGTDWPSLVCDRIGSFASGFFDEGQALWAASRRNGLYAAWREFATHDLTTEIHGLKNFCFYVTDAPETPQAAIERASVTLGLGAEPGTYFHQLLLTLGGWVQLARHIQFKAELEGRDDTTALELLAVRLIFEEALYICHRSAIDTEWVKVRRTHRAPVSVEFDTAIDGILLSAAERSGQRKLACTLAEPKPANVTEVQPVLQAAFCIDVRSEVFRRSLESLDPGIRTIGFAGFFGLGISHKGFASDVPEQRLPVLLNPSVFTCSAVDQRGETDVRTRLSARGTRAWGRFKLAAVSSFAFVEAMGPVYAGKLVRDGLGFGKSKRADVAMPRFSPSLDLTTRASMAEMVLKAMSLTEGFGRCVLVVGHGANVANNPYASALHCGACGGYAGDVNARLLASLLNEQPVREKLSMKGINIPSNTIFLGALHDTTTDTVTLFDHDLGDGIARGDIVRIRHWLVDAGRLARAERSKRLPRATADNVIRRSQDWAEVWPELGLAGCRAFIAAPRFRTSGRSLDGQVFLHDYVWRKDEDYKILELILTAPVVVASWISLQYFGSSVAPVLFGAGNKLLHNVVGGIGVVEGNGGNLRAGLPWQCVHDGEHFIHEPQRLTVAVEAPRDAITAILTQHNQVRALFDNGWLNLFALDEKGHMAWRYTNGLIWEPFQHMNNTMAPTCAIRR